VDVGLLDEDGNPLDMGCGFDTFGPIAAHDAPGLTDAQKENRSLLLDTMQAHGFKPYQKEWWHYTLQDEPFPDTYFDFPITAALNQRGDTE
jgi:D-alanyl-D-alanine dipeptidase